ncbi:MAG TPA: hypothetical protein VJ898_06150 [Natrialbaceae archaeon]|nr:hypothetical protein [Natrialbaceae archaeon]
MTGKVKDRYLTPGNWRYNGRTLCGMNVLYATDDRWAETIADHYRTLVDTVDLGAYGGPSAVTRLRSEVLQPGQNITAILM